MNNKSRLWTRNFILIILANFTTHMSFNMLLPTVPIYVSQLSGSNTFSGLSLGLLVVSAIFIRPFAGKALDTKGHKFVYCCGLSIFLVTAVAFNLVQTLYLFLFFRFIQGFGWGSAHTAAGTIAAEVVPESRFAEGMGYFALSWSIAIGIAPYLALLLLGNYNVKGYVLGCDWNVDSFHNFYFSYPLSNKSK